ncbi:hypothetical protein [Fibrella aquatilis]|uniref:Uncharacterized protein n=1 Tax=Fibrella aquatilis TaxID=2817059 RepID=A0A939G3H3_9BACT|nr:hypothetical protein [Fibrella aquatilis]MBO0930410.1 hypothetical protein [Fibrella aquatilis]
MKTLTRHLLYSAAFLAALLFVAGLTLFREAPVAEVILGVLTIIATIVGVGWISYRLNRSAKPTAPTDSLYQSAKTVVSKSELVGQD